MKTYLRFISEISDFTKEFRKREQKFPGVYMFMSVVGRYVNRPEKLNDRDLARLLKRLKHKSDISAYTVSDFIRIEKFMNNKGLHTLDQVRSYMQSVLNKEEYTPENEGDDNTNEDV